MRARYAVLAVAALMMSSADHGGAYSASGRRWASGSNVVMQLQLGSSSGGLIDGSSSWNSVAESALAIWNPYLTGVSFSVVRDSTADNSSGNRLNNVTFADDAYGESFGADTLAITTSWYQTSDMALTETDVVFNREFTWNSYRGSRRSGTIDLRRVALHEFGHVLGLDHPDEDSQTVSAIMNSQIGNVDSLQSDDINGARAIYSSTSSTPAPAPPPNRSPTVTASCNPCSVQTGQTSNLVATGSDPDGDSLSYRWTTTQGSFSNSTIARTVWTAPAQTGTVTATVTAQDGRGGRATATVTLQVVPPDTLRSGGRLLPGQSLTSSNNRYRLVYQTDGNLVLYDEVAHTAPWSSGTASTSAGMALMQADGNFVVYDAQTTGLWSTGTATNANARLALQSDGNVVVYRTDNVALWSAR